MGNNYNIAFRLNPQRVPADMRTMLIAQIRQGFEQAMAMQGGDADTEGVTPLVANAHQCR